MMQHKKDLELKRLSELLTSIKSDERFFINHIKVDFCIISEIIECFYSSSHLLFDPVAKAVKSWAPI